jgi:hypothetical protein
MSESAYLGATEFDLAGRPHRVHAVSSRDGFLWLTTVCGLAGQPYPPAGMTWDEVDAARRCPKCAAALDI